MTVVYDSNAKPRFSIYFAPSDNSELAEFGRQVLQDEALENDYPERIKITRKAAHYGFHSTFKAPMELAEGADLNQLLQAVETFVRTKKPVALKGLGPNRIKGFHALTLPASNEVDQFAADVVTSFDHFRAPMSEADRARRNPSELSARQREYLERYGYPHVLDEFRFHMTLSHRLDNIAESNSYHTWLLDLFSKTVTETPWLDRLAIFSQPNRASAFTRIAEFPVK